MSGLTPERIVEGVPAAVSSDAVLDALETLGIDREVLEHTLDVHLDPALIRLEVALLGVRTSSGPGRLVVEVPVHWSGSMFSTPVDRRHVPHPVPGLEPESPPAWNRPHAWEAPHSAASDLCAALVTGSDGTGDVCGLPRDHPLHRKREVAEP